MTKDMSYLYANKFERIEIALNSANADQRRIAEIGLEFITTLLNKNADCGSSAWNPPILKPGMNCGDAILVRMSDKVARIANLSQATAQVNESLEDTIKDLGAYALLWMARPNTPANPQR